MEEFLTSLYTNSQIPVLSAFILGLMTAISPCPLATNITAMGFISKDIEAKNRVFYSGLIYTLGRAFAYTALALVIYIGADQFKLTAVFQEYGEKVIGPVLIVIGLFMLGVFKFNIPGLGGLSERFQNKEKRSYFDAFLLGVIFAMAFCPYSGVLYFGMLIPISIQSASGLYLPIVFALATGIPVIIFAWLIAYTVSGVGKLYNSIKVFEIWFRRVVALVFMVAGLYYVIEVFF